MDEDFFDILYCNSCVRIYYYSYTIQLDFYSNAILYLIKNIK